MAHTSKTAFLQALTEYGLLVLREGFEAKGWVTFAEFAFSTSQTHGSKKKLKINVCSLTTVPRQYNSADALTK